MSSPSLPQQSLPQSERALDLLVEQACWGLARESEAELSGLLHAEGCRAAISELEPAASALAVAMVAPHAEDIPVALRRSLSAAGAAFAVTVAEPVGVTPGPKDAGPLRLTEVEDLRREGRVPAVAWFGWLAAAAAVVAAVLISTPQRELSPTERLAQLVANTASVISAEWSGLAALSLSPTDHPLDLGISGRVVMDPTTDEGYMEITGLAENNPGEFQYQLWIFDADRPIGDFPQGKVGDLDILTQRPIDGGVFDFVAGPNGSAVIPIDAKLNVGKPVIFAVTREAPGGVVVSDRDIVFVAVAG